MYITAAKLKQKIELPRSRVENLMEHYTGEYCHALHELFDLGYIDSPFRMDEMSVREVLFDEHEKDLKFLYCPVKACYSFSVDSMRYAMLASNNTEFKDIMRWYILYEDSKDKLNKCYRALKDLHYKRDGCATMLVKQVVCEGVEDKSTVGVFPEMLLEEGYTKIEKVCTGKYIIHKLMLYSGFSEEEYLEHYAKNEPFFVSGISRSQEEEFASAIMKGELPLLGVYGAKLLEGIIDYYQSFVESYSGNFVKLPIESRIFVDSIQERVDKLNSIRTGVYSRGGKELYVDSDFVYYQFKGDVEPLKLNSINIGMYTNLSNKKSLFRGIEGVFSYEVDSGMPVFVHEYGIMYMVEVDCIPEVSKEDIYKEYSCKSEDELLAVIRKYTTKDIVVELVLALLYTGCGYYRYNFIGRYEGVTDESFEQFCEEALQIVEGTFKLL